MSKNNNLGIEGYVMNFAEHLKKAINNLPKEIRDMIHDVQIMASRRDNSEYGDIYTGRNAAGIRDDDGNLVKDYSSICVLHVAEGNFGKDGTVLVGIHSDDPTSQSLNDDDQTIYDAVIDLAWSLKRGDIKDLEAHPNVYI